MRIVRLQNVNAVAEEVHKRLEARALGQPLRAFLPAGGSPRPLYKIMKAHGTFWQNRLLPIQVDEFRDPQRPFFHQLETELFLPLGIKNPQLWNIKATADEIEKHITETLSQKIQVALLGLGPNGHVGFHEPGLPANFKGGEVTVSEETRLRIPGIKTNLALTFGAEAFLKADEIMMLVCGEEKRDILQKLEAASPNPLLPASLLKAHADFTIFTDL